MGRSKSKPHLFTLSFILCFLGTGWKVSSSAELLTDKYLIGKSTRLKVRATFCLVSSPHLCPCTIPFKHTHLQAQLSLTSRASPVHSQEGRAQHWLPFLAPALNALALLSIMNPIFHLIIGFLPYFLNLNIHVYLLPTTSVSVGQSFWVSSARGCPRDGHLFLKMVRCLGLAPRHQGTKHHLPAGSLNVISSQLVLGFQQLLVILFLSVATTFRDLIVSQAVPALSKGLLVCCSGVCLI